MGKKVKEFKSGDFIFAKVKGYPAWPARVQKQNGKKYFVYFYGTGETANLPSNMIFDYAENKGKFLNKSVKRRDFNDGVKQIEHDFANNVPLDDVIGVNPEAAPEVANETNETPNGSTINETVNDSAIDTADDTVADTTANTTLNDTAVEDSDDAGALVIDEGKPPQKGKKSKGETKTPAKEPAVPKTPKTPRGKAKKEETIEDASQDEKKKEEEIVSRSGRKIRPKRYIDEQTEENTTLPSPAPKKRRGASPGEKEKEKETPKEQKEKNNIKYFNNVSQSELEDLKEPFKPADPEKENIVIASLPSGQYVGVKLFQSRPSFKNDNGKLQWYKQTAANALKLVGQLEKGQITPQSVLAQLVMDLNLTDEEKATLDKEREIEEKRSRVQFLKTEMKLIELDAKIKTCLCLEKADTDLCLKLLDELLQLDIKPLMLLKHPTCLETVKRMRAYVGNTPSWDLTETDALVFSKQAHRIRKSADNAYKHIKDLYVTPDGLSFWEYFSERVLLFKKATSKLSADELLEMVHEPLEMWTTTSHTMKAAIDAANEESQPEQEKEKQQKEIEEETDKEMKEAEKEIEEPPKKKAGPKSKKASTPAKPKLKRQSLRKQIQDNKQEVTDKDKEKDKEKEVEPAEPEEPTPAVTQKETEDSSSIEKEAQEVEDKIETEKKDEQEQKPEEIPEKDSKDVVEAEKETPQDKTTNETANDKDDAEMEVDKDVTQAKEDSAEVEKMEKDVQKVIETEVEKGKDEPRAKRSRGEAKKSDPPPRSPAKRKAKA